VSAFRTFTLITLVTTSEVSFTFSGLRGTITESCSGVAVGVALNVAVFVGVRVGVGVGVSVLVALGV
jgi:hypothetical protein